MRMGHILDLGVLRRAAGEFKEIRKDLRGIQLRATTVKYQV